MKLVPMRLHGSCDMQGGVTGESNPDSLQSWDDVPTRLFSPAKQRRNPITVASDPVFANLAHTLNTRWDATRAV